MLKFLNVVKFTYTFRQTTLHLEDIAGLNSRKAKAQYISNLIQTQKDKQNLKAFLHFLLSQIDNPANNKELILPDNIVFNSLLQYLKTHSSTLLKEKRTLGDLGDASMSLIKQNQTLLDEMSQKESQSISYVFGLLQQLYEQTGNGSNNQKEGIINQLLSICASPLEVKYLVRFFEKKMRVGLGEAGIATILHSLKKENHELITELEGTILGYQKQNEEFEFGVPVLPMLAQSYDKPEILYGQMVKKKQSERLFLEYKYDGERLQAHYRKGQIELYGRSMECKTWKYPTLVNSLLQQFNNSPLEQAIFDCEMICYNAENQIVPFQDMQSMKAVTSSNLSLICFDILKYNLQCLAKEKLSQRKRILESIIPPINPNKPICYINSKILIPEDPLNIKIIAETFKEAIRLKLEGAIVKKDSIYKPGSRTDWGKLKSQNDVDLVVIGAYWGSGKRKNILGAYLLGALDPQTKNYYPITKIGTGFTEEQLNYLTEEFSPQITNLKPISIVSNINVKPDVWFNPSVVWEIRMDTVSQSPKYYIKGDNEEFNVSLRFPRFLRKRLDKNISDCTTTIEIIRLYKLQKAKEEVILVDPQ